MISFVRLRAGTICHRFIINASTMQHPFNNRGPIFTLVLLQWTWKMWVLHDLQTQGGKSSHWPEYLHTAALPPFFVYPFPLLLLMLPKVPGGPYPWMTIHLHAYDTQTAPGFLHNITWTALLQLKPGIGELLSPQIQLQTLPRPFKFTPRWNPGACCISPPCPGPKPGCDGVLELPGTSTGQKAFVAFLFSPGIFPSKGGYLELLYPSVSFGLEGINTQWVYRSPAMHY